MSKLMEEIQYVKQLLLTIWTARIAGDFEKQ